MASEQIMRRLWLEGSWTRHTSGIFFPIFPPLLSSPLPFSFCRVHVGDPGPPVRLDAGIRWGWESDEAICDMGAAKDKKG